MCEDHAGCKKRIIFRFNVQNVDRMVPDTPGTKIIRQCFIHHVSITVVAPVRYTTIALNHFKTAYFPVFQVYFTVTVDVGIVGVLAVLVVVPPDGIVVANYCHGVIRAAPEIGENIFSFFRCAGRQDVVCRHIICIETGHPADR